MLENISPGSDITVTVTKTPTTKGGRETVRRILLLAPEHKQAKARAAEQRRRNPDLRNRAGRLWNNRPHIARIVLGRKGESSTIKYRPQLAAELESIAKYVSVEPA